MTGDVSDCPLTQWCGVDDHDEEDEATIVISLAEEFLGLESLLDDVSVTTGFDGPAADSYFIEFDGPEPSNVPDPFMYHDEELQPAIEAEIRRDLGTVLKPPYLTYNWFGRLSTTLSPWHTSADV